MPVLETYANPQGADFEKLDSPAAQKLDLLNKEAHRRNVILAKHAQLVLLEVDPSNRKLKSLQAPTAPASVAKRVEERDAERAEKEQARGSP